MKKNSYFFLLAIALICFQCSGDQAQDTAEATDTETQEVVDNTPAAAVAQPAPETQKSASEILEENEERYQKLHRLVTQNMSTINDQINSASFPQKMKNGLKASFEEVAKYDNVTAFAQTSKYNSAETLEQFMNGLDLYIERWGIK